MYVIVCIFICIICICMRVCVCVHVGICVYKYSYICYPNTTPPCINGLVQPIRLNAHASHVYKYRAMYRFTLYYVISK